MRIHSFPPAFLVAVMLCASENGRAFAEGNGDANENVAATLTPEEASIREAAYEARLAARAAADEGFFLGQNGDFAAARKKFDQALELDPAFSPAYRLRAAASLQAGDWAAAAADLDILIGLDPNDADVFNERGYARRQVGDLRGALDDFDRCIALGSKLALAYANREEVTAMLAAGDADDAAVARSLAPIIPHAPPSETTPGAGRKQTRHAARGTGAGNETKGATR